MDEERENPDDDKDTQDMERIVSLLNGMLDYYAWKQDSSELGEAEFNEVIEISYVLNPEIYHYAIITVFKDIKNDAFIIPYKFVGLAAMILNLCIKIKDEGSDYSEYCSADDLN